MTGANPVTTVDATPDGNPGPCFPSNLLDVWYIYTAPSSGVVQFQVSSAALSVSAYSGCGGTLLGCGSNSRSTLALGMTAGEQVLLRVASATVRNGTLTIVGPADPLPNDECENAQVVTRGSLVNFSSLLATNSPGVSASCAPSGRDIWFTYTPATSGLAVFSTCGCDFDTVISVYDACGGNELACDDNGGCGNSQTQVSQASVFLNAGQQVYIRVAGRVLDNGSTQVTFGSLPGKFVVGPPTNDDCANALPVTTGNYSYEAISTATMDGGTSACENPEFVWDRDVWFEYVAPATGIVQFVAPGGITVMSGCNGEPLACHREFTTYPVTAGQMLLLRGGNNNLNVVGAQSSELRISAPVAPLPNDDCAGAIEVQHGEIVNFNTTLATDSQVFLPSCGLQTALPLLSQDVWFRYTAPTTGPVNIVLFGSANLSTTIAVYAGCNGEELGCSQGSTPLSLSLSAGESIVLRVGRNSPWVAPLVNAGLSIGPPVNDDCSNPIPITSTSPALLNSIGASPSPVLGTCCPTCPDIWFSYTAPTSGVAVFRGPSMSVFTSCNAPPLACNNSVLPVPMNSGETVLIRVTGTVPSNPTSTPMLSVEDPVFSPNDECVDAQVVHRGDRITAVHELATTSPGVGQPPCVTLPTGYDLWYQYTADVSGTALFVCNTGLMTVYDACGGNLLGCKAGINSVIETPMSAGQTVFIRKAITYNPAAGQINYSSTDLAIGPANNDGCSDAAPLTAGSYPIDLTLATLESDSIPCNPWSENETGVDQWYEYVAPTSGVLRISLNSDWSGNPSMAVFDSCGGTLLGCGLRHEQAFPVTAGQRLVIRIAARDRGSRGTLQIVDPEPPTTPNDECAGAIPVTVGANVVSNVGASNSIAAGAPLPCVGFGGRDVWFRFVPPSTGMWIISQCNRDIDPQLSVYSVCGGPEVGCGSDYACNNTYGTRVASPMIAGQSYYIRLSTTNGTTLPNLELQIDGPFTAPSNDECASATVLTSAMDRAFDLTSASQSGVASPSCQGFCCPAVVVPGADVWFTYTAPTTGRAAVNTCMSNGGVFTIVYDGCGGEELGCTFTSLNATTAAICGGPGSSGSQLLLDMIAGHQYKIRIAAGDGATGQVGTVHIDDPLPAPPNDTCAGAIEVDAGVDIAYDSHLARTASYTPGVYSVPSPAGDGSTGLAGAMPILWYSYTAPDTPGVLWEFQTVVCPLHGATSVYFDDCGNPQPQANGVGNGCGDPPYPWGTTIKYLAPGQRIYFAIGTRSGFEISDYGPDSGTFRVEVTPVHPWFEIEDGGASAGEVPSAAQVVFGEGPLDRIVGSYAPAFETDDRIDLYRIRICDPGAFSVVTNAEGDFPGSALRYMALALFDANGRGVAISAAGPGCTGARLSNAFVADEGVYLLAVYRNACPYANGCGPGTANSFIPQSAGGAIWDLSAFSPELPPNGPGAADVLNGWTRSGCTGIPVPPYRIGLTGCCFICRADFNASGLITVQDIFDFLSAYFSNDPRADVNGVGGITVQDIFDFLAHYFAGC